MWLLIQHLCVRKLDLLPFDLVSVENNYCCTVCVIMCHPYNLFSKHPADSHPSLPCCCLINDHFIIILISTIPKNVKFEDVNKSTLIMAVLMEQKFFICFSLQWKLFSKITFFKNRERLSMLRYIIFSKSIF